MFSSVSNNMPSTSSVISAYTTFAASAMLARTVVNEFQNMTNHLIPQQLRERLLSKLGGLIGNLSSQMTLVIDEYYNGLSQNQIFEASETYLRTKITPTVHTLKVSKSPRERGLTVTMDRGEKIIDIYKGIQLVWEMISTGAQKSSSGGGHDYDYLSSSEMSRSIQLSFDIKHREVVLGSYLPYVLERSQAIKEENKVVKLYSLGNFNGDYDGGGWGSVNLDHPSTFDTLAMDPALKNELIHDLDRFLSRRNFYKRVGKTWKRGYLLYGPPGTGKSSLIVAMANYLNFDIYDLELTSLQRNSDLRRLLVTTKNRSILVIEDIDCSVELQNRLSAGGYTQGGSQLTLSGLLNFIDGLWSSCGDERIIVFTTNHKDKLDTALLRPGRMDMHIHMSYCTPSGFKVLASNYLGVNTHYMFGEIEKLITEVEVTPAEIAEELMKSEEADVALGGLVKFLQRKSREHSEVIAGGGKKLGEEGKESEDIKEECERKAVRNKKRKTKRDKRKGRGF